jgi:small-conductance mechanosensitive channel
MDKVQAHSDHSSFSIKHTTLTCVPLPIHTSVSHPPPSSPRPTCLRLCRRRLTKLNQALNAHLHKSSARTQRNQYTKSLTIQLLPSSVLFVMRSEKMATASSYCLFWRLVASSFICWMVSGFSKSSLFKWSKRMLRRFSVSATCCLYCEGALAFTRCMSASRTS